MAEAPSWRISTWSMMAEGMLFRSTAPPTPASTRWPFSNTSKRTGLRLRRESRFEPLPPLLNWVFNEAPKEDICCSTSPMEVRPEALIWLWVTTDTGWAVSTSVRRSEERRVGKEGRCREVQLLY